MSLPASWRGRVEPAGAELARSRAATEHEGPCLACTFDRRLQAPVTLGAVALHALPTVANVALAPLIHRPVCGVRRLTPLASRPVTRARPSILDLPVTILDWFGISRPEQMVGRSLFG
jgi:hypothetical protein